MTEIHALSGAYAVDALDGDERARFEEHLAGCADCRSEVDSLREAAALLAETSAATPPAGLRDTVLTGITTVRPLPPEPAAAPVAAPVVSLRPRRRRRTVAWLAAAAAVVAIGGGAVVWQQVDEEQPSRIEQLQAAGDVQRYTLPVGDGSATVYRSEDLNEAAIVTKGVPPAPEGKEYVLWLQHGTMMTPAGVLPTGSDNKVFFSGDAATADAAAVSIEDAGTDPTTPSADVVAVFAFS
ncbi:MAG TPA: anti-sigma factor [Nocardioides sp.]|uniref:anti-sigma factor n=1 Tax=Nocardioides sp. TaxID=35761 RepID=UPI002E33E864|nr:anti-sigma factor [Nocardioides sp.]HEX5086624.1 anti-sigma factor [Nocardioides sp.]